jgi:hypothetical protein
VTLISVAEPIMILGDKTNTFITWKKCGQNSCKNKNIVRYEASDNTILWSWDKKCQGWCGWATETGIRGKKIEEGGAALVLIIKRGSIFRLFPEVKFNDTKGNSTALVSLGSYFLKNKTIQINGSQYTIANDIEIKIPLKDFDFNSSIDINNLKEIQFDVPWDANANGNITFGKIYIDKSK